MRGGNLPVCGLEDVGVGALQDARARTGESLGSGETRSVFAKAVAAAASFDADHFYFGILQKFVEQADSIRAATNAGHEVGGQALFRGNDLRAGFAADAGMKIADHRWIRMCAEDGAEKIVRGADVGNPVAHGFVDGVF